MGTKVLTNLFCARARTNIFIASLLLCASLPAFAADPVADLVASWRAAAPADRPALEAKLVKAGPQAVAPLLPEMRRKRASVLDLIARIGEPAVPELLGRLSDPKLGGYAREALPYAIGPSGASLPALVDCLNDADTRGACGFALLKAATPKAAAKAGALLPALKAKDPAARILAAQALTRIGRGAVPAAGKALRAVALEDSDADARAAAKDACKKLGVSLAPVQKAPAAKPATTKPAAKTSAKSTGGVKR